MWKILSLSSLNYSGKCIPDYRHTYREMKQRKLDYNIQIMKLASKIKVDNHDRSEDSDEPQRPVYSNISAALKVLQFISDNEEDGHVKFNQQDSKAPQSGSTKEILIRVKEAIEAGIFAKRNQLPEDLQDETYEKDVSIDGDHSTVPFFEIVDKLLLNIEQIKNQMTTREDHYKTEVKNLRRQVDYKNKNIETLEKQLSQIQQKNTHPIFEQYNEIVNQNYDLITKNSKLEYKVDQYEEDLEELKAEHSQTQLELRVVKDEYKRLENEYDKLNIVKDQLESKIIEITEDYHTNLRNYQNSLVLLKSSQESRKK